MARPTTTLACSYGYEAVVPDTDDFMPQKAQDDCETLNNCGTNPCRLLAGHLRFAVETEETNCLERYEVSAS